MDSLALRGPVHAFSGLWTRGNAGDAIEIRDASGRKTAGIFERVSSSSIVLRTNGRLREIPESDALQVARRVDHLWTGALVGAFLGALVGVRSTEHTRDASPVGGALFQAMPFMAVGAFIGANIPRHAVVYSTTSSTKVAVSPLVSAHRKGLALSFEF